MIKFLKFKTVLRLFCVLFGVYLTASFLEANAASLYFMPQAQDVYAGDTFIVEARINTDKKDINTIEGTVKFPGKKLSVTDISKGGSIINLWIKEPFFSNEKGEIGFSGGIPNGFNGEGIIMKISFRAIAGFNGFGEISFGDDFKVLLNDGKGTADTLSFAPADYQIKLRSANLPIITSSSHPNADIWYANDSLYLRWDLFDGAQYSYILSKDALAEPDNEPDRPEGDLQWMGDMKYEGLDDGIYYFHLKQKPLKGDWSEKISFRAMIDKTPPKEFKPEIVEIEGKKYLAFTAIDENSGIDHYEIIEKPANGNWFNFGVNKSELLVEKRAENPYLLKDQRLTSDIEATAFDKAGNKQTAEIKRETRKDFKKSSSIIFALGIILAIALAIALKKKIKK